MKAIEQEYNNEWFPSRLETRWRIFFDQIRVPVHHEYQGYDLDGLWYLPDYYIPKWKCYFEAKDPSIAEDNSKNKERRSVIEKASRLNIATGYKVILCFGGFSSEEGDLMIVFMPGFNKNVGINLMAGWGKFGTCRGVDVLYLETPNLSENTSQMLVNQVTVSMSENHPDLPPEIIEETIETCLGVIGVIPRKYLIPLHSSIGFNFAMIKHRAMRIFAPFSDPLLCNFNASHFNTFKPYSEAYLYAKQYELPRTVRDKNQ